LVSIHWDTKKFGWCNFTAVANFTFLDHFYFYLFFRNFRIRNWYLLLASEGDEFGQRIGEGLKNCKCHLYGKIITLKELIPTFWSILLLLHSFWCFAEWKKTPDIVYEWGFKGSDCEFLFQKETSSSGISVSLCTLCVQTSLSFL